MLNKIISFLYYSLFFITPLLMAPFTSELFEFNKLIFIYGITLGVVFFWLLKKVLDQKIIIKKTPFDIPILLFLASQILSTLFSIDKHTSFYGYYGRFNGGLISIISYVVLFFVFVSFQSAAKQILEKILKISLYSSLIVIVWGLTGKLGVDFSCLIFVGQLGNNCWTDQFRPAERMFSTLGQPNWLGAYLAINFFIGAYFLLKKIIANNKVDTKTVIVSFYLILNFTAILFTRSRSALFAVLFGTITLFIYASQTRLKKVFSKNGIRLVGLILVCLLFSLVVFKTGINKIDRYLTLTQKSVRLAADKSQSLNLENLKKVSQESGITTSADIRKIVWKGAFDLGLRYPISGTGVETFAYSYYFTRPAAHNLTSEWDYLYNKAHNEYLNYFATTGFIGLLAYLFLIISTLMYGWKNIKYKILNIKNTNQKIKMTDGNITIQQYNNILLTICLIVSYITILVTNFFGFSTTTINLYFYLIPAFFVVLNEKQTINNSLSIMLFRVSNYQSELRTSQQFSIFNTSRLQKILMLLLVLTTLYLLVGLTRYYIADIKYSRGDNFSKLGDFQKAAQLLNEANNLKTEHVYEDKLSYVLANIAFTASYQKEKTIAKNMRNVSDELNKKSLIASPKNVLYWKTRAKNYYLYYQISLDSKDLNQAIAALERARTLSPTDPKIPYSLAIFYSLLESEEKDSRKKLKFQQLALQEINISINLKTDYRDGYYLKGQFLKKAGKPNEAKKVFNYILENLNPNDSEVNKELETL